ncbi:MAG: exodeoxyribonuclease VII large subunit, exodeoxyribonuclease VII large subunit [Candidatus Moranbacteria bacterium GW2011_GWC1_45_18]|nr:MAG: Exodeoxyribonuclease 7 large subunit [Candidatus Moranbacteria bacterium GW2011_GWC2_40_12]KKT33681.1 MAG: Exodeoxyribonuclease 7 large subunit [Candidatus Moranbacteria bacterium GW2011_GWF2_44_10]KKT70123.1 MAG: Exodeoxyribonuclease 7 large subunit [Candidatus Moranbacteria bacterium GW2011_GWF1_44_4]KKT99526.1 MAG: exodeoxyribonuclease VII large subunit, exodeoxyribonuclease VII large subunit [Candidatus Moranbacteria bacterium GW2011_GWC1_45_18]OGI23906.1 MAG: exodeoxyribonuclease V
MNKALLEKLKKWQSERARRDNVEAYRVLPYSVLGEIARRQPQSAEELLEVKGIKEKKLARYGKEILALVAGELNDQGSTFPFFEQSSQNSSRSNLIEDKIYEVGEYLDFLNIKLLEAEAKIKGEVSSVENRGNYVFFGIKDKSGESLLNCFIWGNDYSVSGVELEEGMEVIIWGYPNVYRPSGRMSFQTKLIEVVGEGALKKAYDDLKRKLEAEGLFAPERKKKIPDFSHKIGLITSHQGAAIGDFTSNLGSYGFQIKFFDSRVEGKQAVFDLTKALKWFNKNIPSLDAIVLVRGGGSFESLQAFNTESLVREVANSKIPILAGIGHEKDISLAALAADKMVSTPTGAAVEITKSWDEAAGKVDEAERNLLGYLSEVFERFKQAKTKIHREAEKIGQAILYSREKISSFSKNVSSSFSRQVEGIKEKIKNAEKQINLNNPERQLKLGYSLVSLGGKIVRSVKRVRVGDEVDIKVSDGEMKSEIKDII